MTFDLTTERLNRGWSQSEAARQIDVSPYAYRQLERGRPVSPGNAKKVADYFQITVTELLATVEVAA